MFPELRLANTMILERDNDGLYPTEESATDFFALPNFSPVNGWKHLIAGEPRRVREGKVGVETLRLGYTRLTVSVRAKAFTFKDINFDSIEHPLAIIQKIDAVVSAHVAIGSVVGVDLSFLDGEELGGDVEIDITRVKQLLEVVM